MLEWHDARPGDTFFIPSGTVHAIGAGLVLCEIQQNSDTTYRLYDYGRGRELHLAEGEAVSQLGSHAARSVERAGEHGSVLVECPFFVTERIEVDDPVTLPAGPEQSPEQTIIVVEGGGEIAGEAHQGGRGLAGGPGRAGLGQSDAVAGYRSGPGEGVGEVSASLCFLSARSTPSCVIQ